MSRPEALFPLFAGLETLDGVGPKTAQAFAGLGVERPKDLLFLLPHSGVDRSRKASIRDVVPPEVVTVEVEIGLHVPPRQKGRPYRVMVRDARTEFQLVFFHAKGDYLQKLLPTGQRRLVSGRIELFDGIGQMVHPDHVLRLDEAEALPAYEPVYPLTAGVTQKLVARAVAAALARVPDLPEWIDPALKAREGWPDWAAAVRAVHAPAAAGDIAVTAPARQRLAYDELFAHQLTLSLARQALRRGKGVASHATGHLQRRVLASLPYQPTGAQQRAMAEIAADMAQPLRMNRLLQGDVGAGKTLVAFLALLVAVEAGGQGVMMAPTEILARQHLDSLRPLAEAAGVVLEILTGRDKGTERAAKLAALAAGDIQILVGTHAVFQKDVAFRDLRTAVIEVGVNVPNASIMVIERAETFGLAQLHQLRGRVGRGAAESTCLLMYQPPLGDTAERRLKTLRDTEDGFRIAEEDLAMRGAGDLIGTAQSGLPRFRIADLERQAALMALAQSDARRLLADDPALTSPRGTAARGLLWLLDQDRAIRLISVG